MSGRSAASVVARVSVLALLALHGTAAHADRFIECDADAGCGSGRFPFALLAVILAMLVVFAVIGPDGPERDFVQGGLCVLGVALGPMLALAYVARAYFDQGPLSVLVWAVVGLAVGVKLVRRLFFPRKGPE